MWWGGASAPARFLVPIVPLLAPMIAVAVHGLRSAAAAIVSALLVLASVAVAAAGVDVAAAAAAVQRAARASRTRSPLRRARRRCGTCCRRSPKMSSARRSRCSCRGRSPRSSRWLSSSRVAVAGRVGGFAAGAAGRDRVRGRRGGPRRRAGTGVTPARDGAARASRFSCGPTMAGAARPRLRSSRAHERAPDPRADQRPRDALGRRTERRPAPAGRPVRVAGGPVHGADHVRPAASWGAAALCPHRRPDPDCARWADGGSPIAFELPVDAPVWVGRGDPSAASAAQAGRHRRRIDRSHEVRARRRRAGDRGDRGAARGFHRLHRRRHLPGRRRVLDAEHGAGTVLVAAEAHRRSC